MVRRASTLPGIVVRTLLPKIRSRSAWTKLPWAIRITRWAGCGTVNGWISLPRLLSNRTIVSLGTNATFPLSLITRTKALTSFS